MEQFFLLPKSMGVSESFEVGMEFIPKLYDDLHHRSLVSYLQKKLLLNVMI